MKPRNSDKWNSKPQHRETARHIKARKGLLEDLDLPLVLSSLSDFHLRFRDSCWYLALGEGADSSRHGPLLGCWPHPPAPAPREPGQRATAEMTTRLLTNNHTCDTASTMILASVQSSEV